MAEYSDINITNLLLNPVNPRHNAVQHQIESISAMVQDQGEKLVALARHIVENGLNPTEFILVKREGDKWIVREGNRRITVLKLLNEPGLVPDGYPKIRREFRTLSTAFDNSILKTIPCVVLESEAEINEWVRLKHTGQNDGAGAVGWDPQQSSRFKAIVEGTPDMRTAFLDYLQNSSELPTKMRSQLYDIKKTNFDRLMGDPDVRKLLGLKVEEDSLVLVNGINRYLKMALQDLIGGLSVGRIYHKRDRQSYMEELQARSVHEDQSCSSTNSVHNPQQEDSQKSGSHYTNDVAEPSHSDNSSNSEAREARDSNSHSDGDDSSDTPKKAKNYPLNRNTIVPSVHKLVIKHPRILKIFNELKLLSVTDYPNAVAVLFRAFIELSADHYLEEHGLIRGKLSVDSTLGFKLDAVAKHIQDSGAMTEHQLRPVRQMTSSPSQNQSVKTFHSYVHNKNVTPSAADLKSAWDDLWPFIEIMWS